MCKIFKFENKIGYSELLFLVTILFTLYTFSRGCSTEKKLAKNEYFKQANEYRPYIFIESKPDFIRGIYQIDTAYIGADKKIYLGGEITINAQFTITNIENAKANIKEVVIGDEYTYIDVFRRRLLEEDKPIVFFEDTTENIPREILPNKAYSLDVTRTLRATKSNKFILHIIILYTNDLNHFYDTYQWVEFSYENAIPSEPGTKYYKGLELPIPPEEISYITHNHSSKIYSTEERQTIFKNMEKNTRQK